MSTRPHSRPRPIADLLDPCLKDVMAKQGFARADILAAWPEIVGETLAARCAPTKIEWPRGRQQNPDEPAAPATMVLRVEGAFALELQHLAPVVIERINAHLGWRCIGKLALKQGPLPRPARPAAPEPLSASASARLDAQVAGVEDAGLRAALGRLGDGVLRAKR